MRSLLLGTVVLLGFYGCAGNSRRDSSIGAFSSEPYSRMADRLSEGRGQLSGNKIAVLPFSYVDGRASSDGTVVAERLLTRIINRRKLEAVERALLEKVLGELKFQHSGAVDERTIKGLGKVLGVEAVVTGTLIRHRNGRLEVNARLIKTETAAIIAAAGEIVAMDWDAAAPSQPALLPQPRPAAPSAVRPPSPIKDPVRWWRADGNALDEITGRTASALNGAAFAAGADAQSFSLDGQDDYVSAGIEPLYDSLFDGRNPFSVSFWIKSGGKDAPQGLFAKGIDPVMTALYMNSAAHNYGLTFDIKNGHSYKLEVFAAEGPVPGRWEHWAVSYDGSRDTAGMTMYRNGIAQPLTRGADSFGDNLVLSPTPLEFGRLGGGLNWHFRGQLDDIRLYNRVLAPAEVAAIAGQASALARLPRAGQ